MIEAYSNIRFSDYCHYVYTALSRKKIFKIFLIVSIACFGVLIAYLIYNSVKGAELKFVNFLPLIALIAFYIFYVGLFFGMSAKQYSRAKDAFSAKVSYLFYNNKFVIAKPGTNEGLNVFYENIQFIIESGKRMYFFIAEEKSYMLRTDNFVKGDINQLRTFIKEHCKTAKIKMKK